VLTVAEHTGALADDATIDDLDLLELRPAGSGAAEQPHGD